MKKQIKLREYQVNPTNNVISKLELGKKVILNGCPGSGKTEMAIYIMKKYLDSGKKVLVLAHSTNVLKDNFQDRWNDYYDNHSNLTICIPQSYKEGINYDLVVVDEAHQNYLAKVVQSIVKNIPTQLLLTGTPSNLIYKGGFEVEVIAMEDVPREFFAKTGIELLSTCYKWSETDYNSDGNLKWKASITKSDTESTLDAIISKLIERLANKSVSAERFNKPGIITRIQKAIFKKSNLGKTMFVCSRKSQADYVNNYLIKKGYNSKVSHSTSDNDSTLFESFKNGEFDVLVVVNRGRLGFSDDELMNIIDMSGTKNPNLIYQMFARCVRGNQSQQKLFMKLSPTGDAMHDLTSVATQMALSLMFNDVISVFNGKNMKGMFIPLLKSNSETKKVLTEKNKKDNVVEKTNNRVVFPQYTTDVLVELKAIRYSLNDELSIYKNGEIGEIIKTITGGHFPNNYWTVEKIKNEALKYNKKYDWQQNSPSSYTTARGLGIIDECSLHMTEGILPRGSWNTDTIIEESKKYTRRSDWQKSSPGSYNAAKNLGIFDECVIGYEESRIKNAKVIRSTEDLIEIAKKYKTAKEWMTDDKNSYKFACKKKLISICAPHFPKKGVSKIKWTLESLKKDINGRPKAQWKKESPSAVQAAYKNGWMNNLFPND